MPDDMTPIFLIKKLAGVFLLIIGSLLAATGLATSYSGLTFIGSFLLAVGLAVLILKVLRRNQA